MLRLQRLLEKIEELIARRDAALTAGEDPQVEARELGLLLLELYGDEALDRAKELELRSENRPFAEIARFTVEWLEKGDGRLPH